MSIFYHVVNKNTVINIAEIIAKYDKNIATWLRIYRNGTRKITIGNKITKIPPKSCYALQNMCTALKLRANEMVFSAVRLPENALRELSHMKTVDCETLVLKEKCKEVKIMKIVKDVPKNVKKKWNVDKLLNELEKLDDMNAIETDEKELKKMIGVESKTFLKSLRARLNKLGYSVSIIDDKVYISKK